MRSSQVRQYCNRQPEGHHDRSRLCRHFLACCCRPRPRTQANINLDYNPQKNTENLIRSVPTSTRRTYATMARSRSG